MVQRARPHQEYGPFVHILNKGGLHQIVVTGKLRASNAANNMPSDIPAVRAYVGSFEHQKKIKNWSGRDAIFIEFKTEIPNEAGAPPGLALWRDTLIEGHLPIKITRILNGEGEPVDGLR